MVRVHNKSSKPDNIVEKEHQQIEVIRQIEQELPSFMRDYFMYLRHAVALSTRLAYLRDIRFFCRYLVDETELTRAEQPVGITQEEFAQLQARDINFFLGDYCVRYYREESGGVTVYENHNRSLSRKKSALTSLLRFLYRNGQMPQNLVDGLNPIKLPKPQPDAIKRLYVEELNKLLEIVSTGKGLTEKERIYWERTRYRDRAILLLFVTYGLRLKELQELNLSSFNFTRGEFILYRKRGKESLMPLNQTVEKAIRDYIDLERPQIPEEDALFLSMQKRRLSERSIRVLVKKYTSMAMEKPRDDGYSPHKLRATAASTLIEFGFSIYDVQNLLDHDNVTTTQLYAAHRKHAKREIVTGFELDDEFND